MTKRLNQLLIPVAAVVAVVGGYSAIASAQGSTAAPPVKAAQTAPAEPVGGPDTDNIQSGDQTTPDTGGVVTKATAAQATEAPGTEQNPASEQPGAPESAGESAANSDGPGGHADEPGNAAADHQFQGTE